MHRLLAGRDEVERRDPPPVPPRDRPRADGARRARRRGARGDQGPRPEPFDGVSMRYELRPPEGAVDAVDAVLRDARLAGDLARRLEGGHEPSDDRRLEQLQRRRVGAVPHRGRPLRAAQPRRRAAGEGAGSSQNLWFAEAGAQRRLPARRPLAAGDPPHPTAGALRRRGTATCTSRTRRRCPSPRRSTSATARSGSARWSTSRPRAPRACSSRTGSRFGGHALYVKDNRLHYVYNFVGMEQQLVVATEDIPIGEKLILAASFDKDGEDPPGVANGTLSLWHGDTKVGEGADQDPARQVHDRRRGALRWARRRLRRDGRLSGDRAVALHGRDDPAASPSTSAASRTSTSSARPRRC